MTPKIRTVTITGPLRDETVACLVALLEVTEPSEGGATTMTVADHPDRNTELLSLVRASALYRNDAYPSRRCDQCDREYRGPAVFCSLLCAVRAA